MLPQYTSLAIITDIVQHMAQTGLVASLRPDQPVELLLEIGDALLAAILINDVTTETLALCAAAGASAVEIGPLLFPTTNWSMPTMIRMARRLRQLWEGKE
ncbi:MAG: hypothetical protein KDE19_15420 [Caldilineaceae bacterium]|nr:hypothetical protein [Caldilineaceae bacterium]